MPNLAKKSRITSFSGSDCGILNLFSDDDAFQWDMLARITKIAEKTTICARGGILTVTSEIG